MTCAARSGSIILAGASRPCAAAVSSARPVTCSGLDTSTVLAVARPPRPDQRDEALVLHGVGAVAIAEGRHQRGFASLRCGLEVPAAGYHRPVP
jgi:hypothetical protein